MSRLPSSSAKAPGRPRIAKPRQARLPQLVVYLVAEGDRQKFLLSKLGKHNIGKSCLYFKKLADLNPSVVEQLVAGSVAEVRRRYG